MPSTTCRQMRASWGRDMDTYHFAAAVAAIWHGFLRLLKAAIVRAAMVGWMHPCRAEWLLRHLHLVEV